MTLEEYGVAVSNGKLFHANVYEKAYGAGNHPLLRFFPYILSNTILLFEDGTIMYGSEFSVEEYKNAIWSYRGGYNNNAFDSSIGDLIVAAGLVDLLYVDEVV